MLSEILKYQQLEHLEILLYTVVIHSLKNIWHGFFKFSLSPQEVAFLFNNMMEIYKDYNF